MVALQKKANQKNNNCNNNKQTKTQTKSNQMQDIAMYLNWKYDPLK